MLISSKNTHKIKTTKQTQEKKSPHTKKWRENGEISEKAAKTSEKQKRNEQKHRLRTNKSTDSE